MSFIPSFRWSELVLAVREGDRANKIKTMVFIYGVTTENFLHDLLLSCSKKSCGMNLSAITQTSKSNGKNQRGREVSQL